MGRFRNIFRRLILVLAIEMSNSGSDDNSGQSVVLTLKVAEAGSSIDEEILEDLGRSADLLLGLCRYMTVEY